jgi:uncharacterized protein (DUF362 family)/ferredoxin
VDTHPEVVRAVIKLLKESSCRVYVGDGPSVWGNQAEKVEDVYQESGVKGVCAEEGVELVCFDKRRWRGKFPLSTWLDECQYLVSIPKFKTHEFTLLTGALKNLYGLVSGTYKTELHKKYFEHKDFSRIIVDLYEQARPALTVVDGITAMEGDGPASSGTLRQLGLLFAGADGVAVDSVLAVVMGLKPEDVLTTKEAAFRGLGESKINALDILGERLEDVCGRPFLLPTNSSLRSMIPQPIINILKSFIRFWPKVQQRNCLNCGVCIEACPNQAITRRNSRIEIDYSRCIWCFCCQEACPHAAISVKKSLLARLVSL